MASPARFANTEIDLTSARLCAAEAIAYAHSPGLSMTKRDNLREYVGLCDDVTAGRALFTDAFPHGAESTFLYLAYGG